MFESFSSEQVDVGDARIFVRRGGTGDPLLLLHGFPETGDMWHRVAPALAPNFTVVCADLRGYGRSSCPPSSPDHAPYSKRVMARDMVDCMRKLGHGRFFVAGHDRGGRVAYRMALDSPDAVRKLAVLDVLPTSVCWDLADANFALGFWPWAFLAQDAPLPERLLMQASDEVVNSALTGWGTPRQVFPEALQHAYAAALREHDHARAICEEYRAAATLDREHDHADRLAGRKMACPLLVLWSARGPLGTWYRAQGGPLAIWKGWADAVQGCAMEGGHFFPEELPAETSDALRRFFQGLAP
jgi:haloacetate dehalogenase